MASLDLYNISIDHYARSKSDGLIYVLAAFDVQSTGLAVTGGTIRCDIYSIVENKYWDATNSVWSTTISGSLADHTASEVGSTPMPGIYKFGGLPAFDSVQGCTIVNNAGDTSKQGYIIRWVDHNS